MNRESSETKSNLVHPVIMAISQRAKERSKPGKRNDNYKIGLVIEGGAMRGINSAAELVALDEMGLNDCFDTIYGESVGAINGAWFLSHQINQLIRIYFNFINKYALITPLNIIIGRPTLNLGYLHNVAEGLTSFNFPVFKNSGVEFNILATRANWTKHDETPPEIIFNEFKDKEDLFEIFKAALSIPFLCGKPYRYRDISLWDGGVIDKFPIKLAEESGCTHILALSTVAEDYPGRKRPWWWKTLTDAYFSYHNHDLLPYYSRANEVYIQTLEKLRVKKKENTANPFMYTINMPSGFVRFRPFETKAHILLKAVDEAKKSAYFAFN